VTDVDDRGAWRWHLALAVFAVACAIYLPTARASSLDVVSADFASWQLATQGSRTFERSTFPGLDQNPIRNTWIVENSDGHEAIGRAPGVVVASVPAYWLSQPSHRTDVPAGVTAALLTASTVTLLFLALSRHRPRRESLVMTAAFAFTTPVWSVAADGMWPHTLTILGIVGMGWAADRNRWWLVGLFGGVTLWGRLHAAVICAVFGLLLAWRRRDPWIAVKAGATSGAMLAALCAWTRWYYGTWNPTAGYRTGDFTGYASRNLFDPVNQLGFWISPDRGILVWTPVLILLVPALVRSWRELPDWARALLIAGLVYTFIQGEFNRFSGGSVFWPYRLGLEVLAAGAPALALSARAMGPIARRIWPHVVILQGAVIAVGALEMISMPEVSADRHEPLLQLATVAVFLAIGLALHRWARWTLAREQPTAAAPSVH
jgi:hypothetical protein